MSLTLRKSALCSVALLAGLGSTHAETSAQTAAKVVKTTTTEIPDQGYRVHASLGAGFGSVMDGQYQSAPSGTYTLGSLGVGRRTRRWEWDTNLGWGLGLRSGTDSNGDPVSIRIRSARADLSGRMRLLGFLSVGPVLTANFGTDTRFNTNVGAAAATFYGGAKGTIDIGSAGALPLQAWGELLTELSSFGRDALNIIAGIRISLPVQERRTDVVMVSQAAPRRDVRVVLDSKKVFFKTSSSKIRPEIRKTLSEVADYLAQNSSQWATIEIAGHADVRGPKEYNDRLSMRRAKSVQAELLGKSIAPERVSIEAFGYSRPVDPANTPQAWKQNRRVELTFRNVAEPESLEELLAPLNP